MAKLRKISIVSNMRPKKELICDTIQDRIRLGISIYGISIPAKREIGRKRIQRKIVLSNGIKQIAAIIATVITIYVSIAI